MNTSHILKDTALSMPDKTFVIFENKAESYGAFYDKSLRLAAGLKRLRVNPGDRILIYGHNSLDWLLAEFGIFAAGGVLVTLNPQYKYPEIEHIVRDSGAETIFVDSKLNTGFAELIHKMPKFKNIISFGPMGLPNVFSIDQLIADNAPLWGPLHREGNDLARIAYTSGTTGKLKGVCHRHEGYDWASATFVRAWFKPDDIVLIMMPLAFGYASTIELLPAIRVGATCILLERFHPQLVLSAIEKYKVTLTEGVPTMYAMMLNFLGADQYDLSSLRFAVSAGSVLPLEIVNKFKERFGVPVIDYYALTECAPISGYDMTIHRESKVNSCGLPFKDMAVKIVDDQDRELPTGEAGELVVQGPAMMTGYYKNSEATSEAMRGGWVHTGDMGKMDEDGYLYIVGRKKEMIIRGGANIYPAEIEDVLYSYPKVAEAAVVGVPDSVFGEQVRAVVAFKEGEKGTKEEILRLCEKNLAEYKIPKYVEIWPELPKGPTGKILKRTIREKPLIIN
jgi:long-chain acyl-CoA synthetase